MKNVYLTDNNKGFDFTAIKIFFSVIAILLSVTLPSARAVTENSLTSQPSIIEKLMVDFKNQKSEDLLRTDNQKGFCEVRSSSSTSNQIFLLKTGWKRGHLCPLKGPNTAPNES